MITPAIGLPDRRLAILAFLVMVAYCPRVLSPEMPRWTILAVGLPLVSWLDPRNLPARVWLPLAGLVGWAALTILWTPPTRLGIGELWNIVLLSGVFIAAAGAEDIDPVLHAAGWGITFSAAIAIAQAAGYLDGIPAATSRSGLFFNKDFLAETAAPVLVYVAATRRWTVAGLLALAVALSGSRAAMLAAGLGLIVAWRRPWETKLPPLMLFGMLAALSLLLFGPDKIWSAGNRILIWRTSFAAITPFGHGLGWFRATWPVWEYAHSDLLQTLVETGIVGGLMVVCLAVSVVIGACGDESRPLRAAFWSAMALATVSFPLHRPASAFVAMVLAGGLARYGLGSRSLVDSRRASDDDGARDFAVSAGVLPPGVRGELVVDRSGAE